MATNEQIVSFIKGLPQDQQDRAKSLDPAKRQQFVDLVGQKIDGMASDPGLPSDVRKPDAVMNPAQKIIQGARAGSIPMTPMGAIPMNSREAMDLPRVALNQFQSGVNGLPISVGAQMSDPVAGFRNRVNEEAYQKMITPQTPYGRTINAQAFGAQIVGPMAEMAPSVIKSIPGLVRGAYQGVEGLINKIPQIAEINKLKTMIPSAEESINGLVKDGERLKKISNYLNARHGREATALSYEGAKSAKDAITQSFESAKSNYSRIINNLRNERVPMSDANRILNDLIVDMGLKDKTILDDAEKALFELQKKFDGKMVMSGETRLPTGEVVFSEASVPNPGLDSSELKTFKNVVRSAIKGRPDVEANFYRNYGQVLEANGMGELSGANRVYADAYNSAKEAKALKATKLKQVATGKIPSFSPELNDLISSEKPYGTNYVQKARDLFEKYRKYEVSLSGKIDSALSEKEAKAKFLEFLKTQLSDKRDKVKKIIHISEALGITGGVVGYLAKKK